MSGEMRKYDLKEIHKFLAALAESSRLRILMILRSRPMAVCEIRDILGLSFSTVSKHLSVLREAGLINFEKDGKWVYYRLNKGLAPEIKALFSEIFEKVSGDQQIQADQKKALTVDKYIICQKSDLKSNKF
jgi:ArsR family transcriptional regulator